MRSRTTLGRNTQALGSLDRSPCSPQRERPNSYPLYSAEACGRRLPSGPRWFVREKFELRASTSRRFPGLRSRCSERTAACGRRLNRCESRSPKSRAAERKSCCSSPTAGSNLTGRHSSGWKEVPAIDESRRGSSCRPVNRPLLDALRVKGIRQIRMIVLRRRDHIREHFSVAGYRRSRIGIVGRDPAAALIKGRQRMRNRACRSLRIVHLRTGGAGAHAGDIHRAHQHADYVVAVVDVLQVIA